MKKFTTSLGIFFIISFVTLAATSLKPAEVHTKDGVFTNEKGMVLQGEYEIREGLYDSNFHFQNGKLLHFSFETRKKKENDFEVEGKFTTPESFKGELSIKTEEKGKKEEILKKKLSLDGTLEGKTLYTFATEVLTKTPESLKVPTFNTVETWKLQDGKREWKEEKTVDISKKEGSMDYHMFQKTNTEEEQVFSKGKLVHTSKGSSSSSEMKSMKQ